MTVSVLEVALHRLFKKNVEKISRIQSHNKRLGAVNPMATSRFLQGTYT